MSRLSDLGLKLNLQKCDFHQSEIVYIGHVISAAGLRMIEVRVSALRNATPPYDVTSLESFLGKIGFCERFLENRADVCAPLYNLLRKDVAWKWTEVEQTAFEKAKDLLCSDLVP